MEDLNARTESVIGAETESGESTDKGEERTAVGDPLVDDEPEALREEQAEDVEPTPLEPDDPE